MSWDLPSSPERGVREEGRALGIFVALMPPFFLIIIIIIFTAIKKMHMYGAPTVSQALC